MIALFVRLKQEERTLQENMVEETKLSRENFQRARFLGKSWIGSEGDLHAGLWSPADLKRTSCPGFLCEQLF